MVHELAGKPVPESMRANIPRLVSAYYTLRPDGEDPSQRVAFGTSGHRGSSFKKSFNVSDQCHNVLVPTISILGQCFVCDRRESFIHGHNTLEWFYFTRERIGHQLSKGCTIHR